MSEKVDGLLDNSSNENKQSGSDLESVHSRTAVGGGEKGNILSNYSEEEVMNMGSLYATKNGMDPKLFSRAAALARAPLQFNSMPFLSDEEKEHLNLECTKKYHFPRKLFEVVALGSMAAVVQGMDEAVVNGATLFYPKAFGVTQMKNADLIEGLINGAPYLMCSVACWANDWWNFYLGRKWVIFWCCVISFVTCIWQAVTNNWWHLFISRLFLGIGIGIKSATCPTYVAECTPHTIRGSLVMMWQFWTAVGIMFGYVSSLAFYYVGNHGINSGLNWRLMLGSAGIPALIVVSQVPFVPESPRWLMGKDRHNDAYLSLKRLRKNEIQAARDCFYQYVLLAEEGKYEGSTFKRLLEMFTIRRNRNGAIGAWIVMFMQQFCGINVIAYYSSSIFVLSGFSVIDSLLSSWGFGMINFLFAIPAFLTIDKLGRRKLLLITFPLMALFLFMAGFGFLIPEEKQQGRVGCIITGIYLFACVYSAGEGPVPFTYSAEAFPLYIRDIGMSWATATCWFFNFLLAFTWPRLQNAFTPTGAFCWYAGWNVVGFFLVLFFLYETKGLTLEELDEVFDVPLFVHAKYQIRAFFNSLQRNILRRDISRLPPLHILHRNHVSNSEWEEKAEVQHVE
jgi:sugar porter (SP) family MFS transporter